MEFLTYNSYEEIPAKIANLETFTGNSMRGFWVQGAYWIWSYETVIAKHYRDGKRWLDDTKYSTTTSRH